MKHALPNESFLLTRIADTRDRFSDFAPYVASINDHGVVAFQAALRDGGTGVFTGDGGPIVTVATGDDFGRFYSHPDIDNEHCSSFYAETRSGNQGVFVAREGRVTAMADTTSSFACIGPLGPTMNDRGVVAFRADRKSGIHGVFTATGGSITTIADTRHFRAFHGLPVIDNQGAVVFRADRDAGGQGICQGIYASRGGSLQTIADTAGFFARLGSFPCAGNEGTVVFSATRKTGRAGIYAVTDGEPRPVVEAGGFFESFRGALVNNAGTVIFYATPRGGHLGIYVGPDATADRLLSIGDPLFDSTVADFALNPVSMNHVGQVAIRLELASQMQVIVRADRVR